MPTKSKVYSCLAFSEINKPIYHMYCICRNAFALHLKNCPMMYCMPIIPLKGIPVRQWIEVMFLWLLCIFRNCKIVYVINWPYKSNWIYVRWPRDDLPTNKYSNFEDIGVPRNWCLCSVSSDASVVFQPTIWSKFYSLTMNSNVTYA